MKRAASELGLSEDRCETFIAEKAVERFESTAWLRVGCTWLVESAPYIVIKNGPFTVLECEPFRALTVIESESDVHKKWALHCCRKWSIRSDTKWALDGHTT